MFIADSILNCWNALGTKQCSEIEDGKDEKLKTERHQEDFQGQRRWKRTNAKEGEIEINSK